MSVFWFFAFCIAVIYAINKKTLTQEQEIKLAAHDEMAKKFATVDQLVEDLSKHEKVVTEREQDARYKSDEATRLMRAAKEIEERAASRVAKVEAENKLLNFAVEEVVNLWVNDSFKSISDRLTPDNYATQKSRMEKVFETCRKHGISFDGRQEKAFYVRLDTNWRQECQLQKAKDEQARIRDIMREEAKAEKARASELKKIEQETRELERKQAEADERLRALQQLEDLKQLTADQKLELETTVRAKADLAQQLKDKERRKSMAEQTKAGYVYVISNVGSFGPDVYKVGMTRRLIPEDRVKELGDASVPFPFDIHLMISTENAPKLESKMHELLWPKRLNLVNDRREFFKTELSDIKALVDQHGGTVTYEYFERHEASQWRESEMRRKQGEYGQYDASVDYLPEEEAA